MNDGPVESDGAESAPQGRNRLVVALPLVFFALLAGLFLYRLESGADPNRLPSVLIGKPVPEFALPPLAGLAREGKALPGFSSAELKAPGRVTLVNVWASWCVPCRQEHPILGQIAKDPRVRLVGLNYKDEPENARRFLGALGNPYAAVGSDESGRVGIDWGVYGVPETFVIDAGGTITYKFIGPLSETTLRDVLSPEIDKAVQRSAKGS